jgi:hypothetical protein
MLGYAMQAMSDWNFTKFSGVAPPLEYPPFLYGGAAALAITFMATQRCACTSRQGCDMHCSAGRMCACFWCFLWTSP